MAAIGGKSNMSKILISGFYGFGNLGDEAILETMISRVRRMDSKAEITVLSNNPIKTANAFNIHCVNRKSLGGVLKAIRHCEVLISGGGSLLQDVTSGKSIYYYFFIILCGILFRKKVMLYSHGIGPINVPVNRMITKLLLNRVQCITVRESNSKQDLIDMGVKESLITVTADPVIDMRDGDPVAGRMLLENSLKPKLTFETDKPIVGLSLRTKDFKTEARKADLINAIEKMSQVYHIVLLPFYFNEDIEISRELAEDLSNVYLMDQRLTTKETLDLMSAMDLFVGTRLHSLILGAVAEIAVVGISYDPKIDYFLETIGLRALLTIDSFDSERIYEGVSEALVNKNAIINEVRKEIADQRKLLDNNDALLRALTERGTGLWN